MNIKHTKMIQFGYKIQNSYLRKRFKEINRHIGDLIGSYRKHGTTKAYNKLIEADMKRDVFIWNLVNKRLE